MSPYKHGNRGITFNINGNGAIKRGLTDSSTFFKVYRKKRFIFQSVVRVFADGLFVFYVMMWLVFVRFITIHNTLPHVPVATLDEKFLSYLLGRLRVDILPFRRGQCESYRCKRYCVLSML